MDSEYFMITIIMIYLVRFKIFEWIKLLQRNSHQIPGNRAGRNFITTSRVNSLLITHAECWGESEVYNYQQIQLLNDKFVNGIFGVCLTVNNTEVDFSFLWTKYSDLRLGTTKKQWFIWNWSIEARHSWGTKRAHWRARNTVDKTN